MKILLAVDGSPFTKKMLAYLSAHDELITAGRHEYTALTVQPALPPRARAALSKDIVNEYYADESAKVLDPVSKFMAQSGITVNARSEVGPAGETIAKIAEEGKYDLIIMGTHGHGSLGKLVMGSVSTQVLANCSVPVLLIR
ncbi:MAG TPA: universal stress protein [Comamonas sp.]|uniref:universal stress protein n=1 Tax=Comamonas halotolerans TaxID=3041496 RepID=UPI0024E05A9D|nr:universal stress protein [Comamonas sp. NoAH]